MNLIWIILLLCCCNKSEGCGCNTRPEPRCCEPIQPRTRCCESVQPRTRCCEPEETRCCDMPLQPFAPVDEECGCKLHESQHESHHEPHCAFVQKEHCDCRE